MSNMNREKNFTMYGFVGVLLLASFLMTLPANQYQKIFAQTEGEAPDVNVTEDIQENATDTEIPPFEGGNATFAPKSEAEREAPPVPANAIKGVDLPNETLTKDPDSEPLSVSNRTELLEVLPSNSTKIIEHVNEDLKNSTGEGLLPPAILDKILSGEGQGNDTILDISTPEELDEIKNFSEVTTNQTTEEALEEGEPISISNATNATDTETPSEEQGGEEEQAQAGAETNMTNATGGESPAEEREEQKQAEEEEEQAQTAEETQAGAETNMTNATGGESPAEEREEQKQAEEEKEQEQTQASVEQQQEDTEDGEEQEQAVTNATVSEGLFNRTNVTSMLNATGLEDQTGDSEDNPDDESEDE